MFIDFVVGKIFSGFGQIEKILELGFELRFRHKTFSPFDQFVAPTFLALIDENLINTQICLAPKLAAYIQEFAGQIIIFLISRFAFS